MKSFPVKSNTNANQLDETIDSTEISNINKWKICKIKKNKYKRLRKGNPKTKIKCIAVVNVSAKRAEVTFNVTTN